MNNYFNEIPKNCFKNMIALLEKKYSRRNNVKAKTDDHFEEFDSCGIYRKMTGDYVISRNGFLSFYFHSNNF